MASDADKLRKELIAKGYRVDMPTGRGRSAYTVTDPRTDAMVARFPSSPSRGRWRANVEAAIRRYEETGVPARSSKVPGPRTQRSTR